MRKSDNCCYGCVAPKRHPGCHDHCKERIEQKAQEEKRLGELRHNKMIGAGIRSQKIAGVLRAYRKRGKR